MSNKIKDFQCIGVCLFTNVKCIMTKTLLTTSPVYVISTHFRWSQILDGGSASVNALIYGLLLHLSQILYSNENDLR